MQRQPASDFPPDASAAVIPLHLVLATAAKVLCSAVFVSGRDLDEVLRNTAPSALYVHHLDQVLIDLIDVALDAEACTVSVSVTLDPETTERIVTGYRGESRGVV